MTRATRYILILSVIHVLLAVGLFAVLSRYGPGTESIGKGVHRIMLEDDSYYTTAGDFARNGGSLLQRRIGPGLPLVYSAIYLFPDAAHPYVRWVLTTTFTILTFIVVWKIVKTRLTPFEFFLGSLVTILNPVFIHWSFKSQPDTFVGFLFVVSTYFLLRALRTARVADLLYAALAMSVGIFFRPSVLFVAPALIVLALLARWKRLLAYALALVLVAAVSYEAYKHVAAKKEGSLSYASGVVTFVVDAYQVEEILKQKRFEVATHNRTEETLSGPGFVALERTTEWMDRYGKSNPGASSLKAMIDFTRENPGMVFKKTLLNPVFFFALGSREIEFWVTLVVTVLSFVLVIAGVRMMGVDRELVVVLASIAGYVALFAVIHGLNRYSIAVLPLLYVYSGKCLASIASRLGRRTLSPAG